MKNFKAEILQLYFIAGTQDIKTSSLPLVLEKALQNGVTCFQYREKGLGSLTDPQEILAMALVCQQICQKYHVPFVVNDDVALALKIGADGLHVGQDDEQIESVLQKIPHKMFLGLSCYDEHQVEVANQLAGVDYLGIGPVFGTISKADAKPPMGVKQLANLTQQSQKPVVAIGGISVANAQSVHSAKVAGISVISAITGAEDLAAAVEGLKF